MDAITFYSHNNPPMKLQDHLRDVARRALRIYSEQKEFIKLPINEEFIRIVCMSHDFGKYTSFFQSYIRTCQKSERNLHYHGFISALFGAWCQFKNNKGDKYLPLVAYFVIKHHHGDLRNFDDDLNEDINSDNLNILKYQICDLKKNRELIEKEYGFEIGDFLENYMDVWEAIKKQKFELFERDTKERRIEIYFTILYVYSLLIDSDKKSAARVSELKRKELPDKLIEMYRKIKKWDNPKNSIDKLRNELYYDVKSKVNQLTEVPAISTITAPTGLGKTILNLDVALRYRSRLGQKRRIIYSLPFISIIDQTYDVFGKILLKTLGSEYLNNKNAYLLKHHHLSNMKYEVDNEEKPVSESLLFIESWDSEIVVTTFLQFLYSVIAFKNKFLKKFHNIAGSIIILDEVQNINIEFWKVICFVLRGLTEFFGCKIILSTATRPIIENDFTELVENQDRCFKSKILRRTYLVPKIKQTKTIEEFADYFLENFDEKLSSYLIVLNTKESSARFYNLIKKHLEEKGYEVCYLSANVIPIQRIARIRKIRNALNKNKKIVLVSTQVIEAGVDLDFQRVYRDIAPLDSVIQVAGRCNRNAKFGEGRIEIHKLKSANTEYSVRIYGSTSINKTKKLLGKINGALTEDKYKTLSDDFFNALKEDKSSESSTKVMKDIEKLWFYKENSCIANDFKVIKDLPFYQDVFIEINETAKRIYEKFENDVLNEKDFHKRFTNYQKLKRNFNNYVISIPEKFIVNCKNYKTFPRIPLENIDEFYDKRGCGFKFFLNEEDPLIW